MNAAALRCRSSSAPRACARLRDRRRPRRLGGRIGLCRSSMRSQTAWPTRWLRDGEALAGRAARAAPAGGRSSSCRRALRRRRSGRPSRRARRRRSRMLGLRERSELSSGRSAHWPVKRVTGRGTADPPWKFERRAGGAATQGTYATRPARSAHPADPGRLAAGRRPAAVRRPPRAPGDRDLARSQRQPDPHHRRSGTVIRLGGPVFGAKGLGGRPGGVGPRGARPGLPRRVRPDARGRRRAARRLRARRGGGRRGDRRGRHLAQRDRSDEALRRASHR